MEHTQIRKTIESFKGVNILVVGDVMIDRYIMGQTHRISPEAPVPVVEVASVEDRLGGAANVALNLKKLGATPILLSAIGDDDDGHYFLKMLHKEEIYSSGMVLDNSRKTTMKARVVSQKQQMIRLDYEEVAPIGKQVVINLIDRFVELVEDNAPKAVILQDYNKGVLTTSIIQNLMQICAKMNIPVAVDPKYDNFFSYQNCTLFKPNLKEANACIDIDLNKASDEVLSKALKLMADKLNAKNVVMTLSDRGMMAYDGKNTVHLPAYKRNISDVSGAGDTVISILSLGMALGQQFLATAELANIGGGLVCEKSGVQPILAEELIKETERIIRELEREG